MKGHATVVKPEIADRSRRSQDGIGDHAQTVMTGLLYRVFPTSHIHSSHDDHLMISHDGVCF